MGKIISIKVKEKNAKNYIEYNNKINLGDPFLIALVLQDLQSIGAPIEKACRIFLDKTKTMPF